MNCEQYQSLPMDERSPEDQLAIELARVFEIPIFCRNEADPVFPVQTMAQMPWVSRDCRIDPGMQPHQVPV